MTSRLQPNFDLFCKDLGQLLAKFGFPPKIRKANSCFMQTTNAGVIGIFVLKRFHPDGEAWVEIRVAARNDYVEENLKSINYYNSKIKLTWTFGIELSEIRDENRSFLDKYRKKFTSPYYKLWYDTVPGDIRILAGEAFGHIEKYGWPYLRDNALTDADALRFLMRTDRIAELSVLHRAEKSIAALLLARKTGNENLMPEILAEARQKLAQFAAAGNTREGELFEQLARQLNLLPPQG